MLNATAWVSTLSQRHLVGKKDKLEGKYRNTDLGVTLGGDFNGDGLGLARAPPGGLNVHVRAELWEGAHRGNFASRFQRKQF